MIWLMGFIHCYFDYLGLTLMFTCACVRTWNISNSSHNSKGLIEEGLNSGDYQTLSLSLSLSVTLFCCIKCSVSYFSYCCCDDHRHEYSGGPSRFPS